MAILVDSDTTTDTLSDDGTDSLTIRTREADRLHIFVDDNGDPKGDHAGYELTIEVDTPTGFMEYTTLGGDGSDAETARSWDLEGIPSKMKITLTNRSGGSASHALHAVAVEDA